MTASWTAILLAGERPRADTLAAAFDGRVKALVDVAGEPMVARVARTLGACPEIARTLVLAQDAAAIASVLDESTRLTVASSGDGIARSVSAVAGTAAAPWPVLVTTADHVLLTRGAVAAFLAAVAGCDVAVGVVERRTVLARFPDTRRTWLRFAGGAYTGANLFALNGPRAAPAVSVWSEVEGDRKKGWRLVARFGPVLLLRALTRTISLDAAISRAGSALGLDARAVVLDDPCAAVDVDRPADLALAEAVLTGRA